LATTKREPSPNYDFLNLGVLKTYHKKIDITITQKPIMKGVMKHLGLALVSIFGGPEGFGHKKI